jgi:2-polyprenyl-3-methyl-5-hydroxy-6-metoxy-1,4-benzoquinol methylase
MDGDREALALARTACPDTFFLQADAARLPFQSRSFDILTCLEVLEHLREPGQALAEMARVSRKHLLLSVPNQPYFTLANLLRGRNLRRLGEDPDHIHHWTASQFLALVKCQLGVMKLSYPFPWVLVLCHTKN